MVSLPMGSSIASLEIQLPTAGTSVADASRDASQGKHTSEEHGSSETDHKTTVQDRDDQTRDRDFGEE